MINKPITIYRGDSTDFNLKEFEFGRELRKNVKDRGSTMSQGPGLYFTPNIEMAKGYGKYLTSLTLYPESNFIFSSDPLLSREKIKELVYSFDEETLEIAVSNWDENYHKGMKMLIDTIMNEDNPVEQLIAIWAEVLYGQDPEQYIEVMVSNGIDGIATERGLYVLYNLNYIEEE